MFIIPFHDYLSNHERRSDDLIQIYLITHFMISIWYIEYDVIRSNFVVNYKSMILCNQIDNTDKAMVISSKHIWLRSLCIQTDHIEYNMIGSKISNEL